MVRLAFRDEAAVSGAVLALVLAAAAGFGRVYVGTSWPLPVLASVTAAATTTFLARRTGLPHLAGALCGAVSVWVASSELLLRTSLQLGLPLVGTVGEAVADSSRAAAQLAGLVPPVQALPGFVLWSAWGAGAVMLASDYVAVRRRSIAALLPPLFLFTTCSVFGTPAGRTWAVAAFVAAAVVFALVHRWAVGNPGLLLLPDSTRTPPRAARASRPPYYQSMVLVMAAALAGALLVPALGPDGNGPAGWRHDPTNAVRLTPDPLVSMRTELLQGSDVPAFIAHSSAASYWRLTSLDHFDGSTWEASGDYVSVHGKLPGVKTLPGTRQVVETFAIEDLGSPWLPVAFQPEITTGAVGASYDPISESLLTSSPTADGETYEVVASEDLAALNPRVLRTAGDVTQRQRAAMGQFLQLPRGIPARVARLALQLTGSATSEYRKVLALQDFFHRPPFIYTLSPPSGAGPNALANFLFVTHAGYCQQYAGAFAVLARLAGLPARVAVGFATGTRIAPGAWQVSGADAHAWPEVWFPRLGWVPFEPTPAFGIPHATQYTGATAGPSPVNPPEPAASGTSPSTTMPHPTRTAGHGPAPAPGTGSGAALPASKSTARGLGAAPGRWLVVLLAVASALVIWAGLIRAGRHLRWRRRRRELATDRPQSRSPVGYGRLLVAWEELSEQLALCGLRRSASETPAEWAARAAHALSDGTLGPRERQHLVDLADALSRAAYGGPPVPEEDLCRLEQGAGEVARHARSARPRLSRMAGWLDPRPAWRPVLVVPARSVHDLR
jgi:transglutaminase-like putative cysteine protease